MLQGMLGSGALAEVAGPFKDFADKLGGSSGPMWFSAFKRFLRQENPWALKLIRQATLTIGGVAKDELVRRLRDGGHSVSSWALDILGRIAALPEAIELELGWITVRDLGFDSAPTTTELFARIREVGDLCPEEVGPHLRLADKDQPKGTWYWVAMEPITDSDGFPHVFDVERDGDGLRWLHAVCAHPDNRWCLDRTVVFVLRK